MNPLKIVIADDETIIRMDMKELLEERKRSLAGATAPAQGLCLLEIDYH